MATATRNINTTIAPKMVNIHATMIIMMEMNPHSTMWTVLIVTMMPHPEITTNIFQGGRGFFH